MCGIALARLVDAMLGSELRDPSQVYNIQFHILRTQQRNSISVQCDMIRLRMFHLTVYIVVKYSHNGGNPFVDKQLRPYGLSPVQDACKPTVGTRVNNVILV